LTTILSWLRFAPRRRCWSLGAVLAGTLGLLLLGLTDAPLRSACLPPAGEQTAADTTVPIPPGSPLVHREQLFARLGVDRWHKAGQLGRGIKVAILDSGFRDYRSFLGKALPDKITVRSFRHDGNLEARDSQHGILCGEVIHAIAPEAELLFANWEPERPSTFLDAARWARQQGAKILSCSLLMPSWSDGEGGGDVNAGLAKIAGGGQGAGDLLFFASAGNIAQRHWCGTLQRDAAGYHEWSAGHRNNPIMPWGSEPVCVELYGKGCQDLELLVYDAATGKPVGRAQASCAGSPSGSPCAALRFLPQTGSRYFVRLRCDTAQEKRSNDQFHLVVLGGGLLSTTCKGSIAFPADGPGAFAVGAVDSDGQRLGYSSCGPNSALPKPDFVAEVPFPSLWRERPFAATPPAAPQAAGLAALVWGRNPDWTAEKVANTLRGSARDLGPKGHDPETGYGLMLLP
jgi:hypothetical protein